jgi:hypothetical protein
VAAEEEARDVDAPYGVSPALWDDIRSRASALCDLLDADADEVATRDAARSLRDLLHPLV